MYDFIIKNKGVVVVNNADEVLTCYIGEDVEKFTYGSFKADVTGKVKTDSYFRNEATIDENAPKMVKTNLLGAYNQNNILGPLVWKIFKVSKENIEQSIAHLPTNNRSQLLKTAKNTVISDCYNANPTSTM